MAKGTRRSLLWYLCAQRGGGKVWSVWRGETDHWGRLSVPSCGRLLWEIAALGRLTTCSPMACTVLGTGEETPGTNKSSLGASFFVWVCLGVLCRRVCAGVTNGIYVCQCQGD